jgi:hypothetical protein
MLPQAAFGTNNEIEIVNFSKEKKPNLLIFLPIKTGYKDQGDQMHF